MCSGGLWKNHLAGSLLLLRCWESVRPRNAWIYLYPAVVLGVFHSLAPGLSLCTPPYWHIKYPLNAHTQTHNQLTNYPPSPIHRAVLSFFLSLTLCGLHSSPLRHPGKVCFVFNVVEFPACPWRPAGRRGLCTGGLFDLVCPALVEPWISAPMPKVM